MLSIIGTLGLMILLIYLGKNWKKIKITTFLLIIFIALAQVMIIIFTVYTNKAPEIKFF